MNYKLDKVKAQKLTDAFQKDHFTVKMTVTPFENAVGMMAEHQTAINYDTKQHKKAYYLEGSPYQMGYMMGLLAEPEITRMVRDFTNLIVFSFFNHDKVSNKNWVARALGALVNEIIEDIANDQHLTLPKELMEEIKGILDGCKVANPASKIREDRLWVLNVGVDILLALIYSGEIQKKAPWITSDMIRVPVMCNAFAMFGEAAGGNHYMGRDFMFPTAGVFQDVACMIIYKPTDSTKKPHISMTAPGMVGSIVALNSMNVAVGCDMAPSGNCTPYQTGINSLPMNRFITQNARSAADAVETMEEQVRGTSWNHIIADGASDRACIVETGSSSADNNFFNYPPKDLFTNKILPNKTFFKEHSSGTPKKGLMVRWNDYQYPEGYLYYNRGLWKYFNQRHPLDQKELHADAMRERGYINKWEEKNCPHNYYFAPQRESRKDFVMVINHFIIPEMRLFAMKQWTSIIAEGNADDIQWRYDELNNRCLKAIDSKPVTYNRAKKLIDFLSPDGDFPTYYANSPKSADGKRTRIEGSISLLDMKKCSMDSYYGYYGDEWVKLTLPNYL